MKMLSCTTTNLVVLAWMMLNLCCFAVQGNDCNPGVLSAGWIYPLGDLSIEEGKPVELFCYLNTSHPDGVGGSWKNLSFWVDNELVTEPIVTKYNDSAIRLRIEKAVVSPKEFYAVTCRQNMVKGICTRYVYVGYKPGYVTDFQCTSYNWERLECTWTQPANPISTTYALSYQALGKSRSPCPDYREYSTRRLREPRRRGCVYTLESRPLYRSSLRIYNFIMDAVNVLTTSSTKGSSTNSLLENPFQNLSSIDSFAHMVPNAMESLRPIQLSPNSAVVTWKVPFNLALFPPGLEFRAAYQIRASWTNANIFYNVEAAQQLVWDSKNLTYQLALTLPYANAEYNVTVWARSTAANKSEERFWSPAASTIFRTLPDRPCNAPVALLNSFEVINTRLEQRTATVRWSQLAPECQNGPQSGYEVSMLDIQGNQLSSKQLNAADLTSVSFDNLDREKAYQFVIQSRNDVGYSPDSSQVFLPMSSNMPTSPENVMRIAYNETFFEIQWTGSHASRTLSMATFGRAELNYSPSISHYTVFWCRSVRDSPVQCQGELHAQDVPAAKTSLNVTVPDGKANYQFAVEANQGSYGSGMVWSTCIVIANGNGSQIKQVEVLSVSTFSIDLSWTLPCSVQNGIITGYNIYYCPVVDRGDAAAHDGEEPSCLSTPSPIRTGPNVNKYTIGNLEPYTLYKIVMSVETRLGEGQSSTPLLNRTGEGQPTMPLDLKPTEITNKTLSISWRAPINLNGARTYYKVYRNNEPSLPPTTATEITMNDVESYTDYTVRIKACNSELLCSEYSEDINMKTLIGSPSQPGIPSMKSASDNSSQIEIKWQPPVKPAGPIHLSYVVIRIKEDEKSYPIDGNATEMVVNSDEFCQPGLELKFKVMAVNEAEDGEILSSPWSEEGTYICRYEGLTLAQILGISFGVVLLVLIILFFSICRRFQIKKKRAQTTEVKLPWDTTIGSELLPASSASSGIIKKLNQQGTLDLTTTPGKATGNFYGRLESTKLPAASLGRTPIVVDLKKQQSSNQQINKIELDYGSDRQSHTSSGHSSAGADSLSWQNSRSELSNSDSGAEMEPGTSSPEVYIKSQLEQFTKTLSSHNLTTEMAIHPDINFVQYSAVQLRNRNSAPDLTAPPYVCMGTAPQTSLAAGPNIGYVTLGTTQGSESNNPSPSASPNLSIGSNDSLIGKSDRESSRQNVKIFPLKRNSGSGGYVQACLAEPSVCNDPRVSPTITTSPGYVAFKCHEPPAATELTGTASPRSPVNPPPQPVTMATSGGYVTLGANSAGAAPRAPTSAHYVQMGSQPNHSMSYV